MNALGELIPIGGGDPIPLFKTKLLVGRRESCDIALRFQNVSSHHCELELINGYWHVQDVGSRNGIKVNGERCESKFLLPSDELSIAKHKYEVSYEPSSDAEEPEEANPFAMSLLEKAGIEKPSRRRRKDDISQTARELPKRKTADPNGGGYEEMIADWLSDDDE